MIGRSNTMGVVESALHSIRRWRNRLPHWEVFNGTYFITIRCTGPLPREVVKRLAECHHALEQIQPSSDAFVQQQRIIFRTMEKYLDAGNGFCPFRDRRCCEIMENALRSPGKGWKVLHWVLMPNHIHLLTKAEPTAPADLEKTWQSFKGRTARLCNQILDRQGAFWQAEWFDRWMRSEAETVRTTEYIRANPIKAGLAEKWQDYPWVR